jgi:hypothetical protein
MLKLLHPFMPFLQKLIEQQDRNEIADHVHEAAQKERASPEEQPESQPPHPHAEEPGSSSTSESPECSFLPNRCNPQPSPQTAMTGRNTRRSPHTGPNIEKVSMIEAGPRSAEPFQPVLSASACRLWSLNRRAAKRRLSTAGIPRRQVQDFGL